jgi:hypothetical protein
VIAVLPTPCWELVDADGIVPEPGNHFNEQAACDAVRDEMEQYGQAVTVRQLTEPCVIVKCNTCTREVDSDEFAHVHFPDAELAASDAYEADFAVVGFDVWCKHCRTNPHPLLPTPESPDECLRCAWDAEDHPPAPVSA